jgi:hypothetical protein
MRAVGDVNLARGIVEVRVEATTNQNDGCLLFVRRSSLLIEWAAVLQWEDKRQWGGKKYNRMVLIVFGGW